MDAEREKNWLLLIHQIPPKPNYLRVKIWRRLQQAGAVGIKQSVYALPLNDQSREDFSWILREIVEGGGDGSISEARFVEGLTDEQVVAMFQSARQSDYAKIIQDANRLLAEWSDSNGNRPHNGKQSAQLARLRRRFEEAAGVDFFEAPEKATADILLRDLAARASDEAATNGSHPDANRDYKNKVWVTRTNVFVDRIASGWLIRKFVDSGAAFKFVPENPFTPKPGEVRFDMFDGEFTHEGDRCTFEVMVQRLQLRDRALAPIAEIVHDADLKDGKFGRPETAGLLALLSGLAAAWPDDEQRMKRGFDLFENLYSYFPRR